MKKGQAEKGLPLVSATAGNGYFVSSMCREAEKCSPDSRDTAWISQVYTPEFRPAPSKMASWRPASFWPFCRIVATLRPSISYTRRVTVEAEGRLYRITVEGLNGFG